MTRNWLMVIYTLGFISAFYLGMRFEAWRFRKSVRPMFDRAYNRGWKAGIEHLDRAKTAKLDVDSAVKVLTGKKFEEASYSDKTKDDS